MTEHEELWEAMSDLEKTVRSYNHLIMALRRRIDKLEALQWTDEEVDKLVGGGMLGHLEKGD
jgi:hypothetical protein